MSVIKYFIEDLLIKSVCSFSSKESLSGEVDWQKQTQFLNFFGFVDSVEMLVKEFFLLDHHIVHLFIKLLIDLAFNRVDAGSSFIYLFVDLFVLD